LLQRQSIAIADADLKVTRRSLLPDLSGRFFHQRLYGLTDPFYGYSLTLGVPLFALRSYGAKIRAAALERDYQQSVLAYETQALSASMQQSLRMLEKDREIVHYYENTGLAQAEAIIKAANLAYRGGEISFAELSSFLSQAIDIQRAYLDVLHKYNGSAIALAYYLNQ
jgi:cobalt-zinc-cadmium resistance protein CzcA